MKLSTIFYLLTCAFLFSCGSDQTIDNNDDQETIDDPATTLSLVEAFSELSFDQPLDLQAPDDGTNRVFVAEKSGKIKVFSNEAATTTATTFLDLGAISSTSEQGLLGFAFHPNYGVNGFFYVYYNPSEGISAISRFKVSDTDSNLADRSSEQVILEIPQPFTNHNGGQLAFGPYGYLYIASGDGGSGGDPQNHGQNRTTLLGNILRIDVDNPSGGLHYGIPPDNPFINDTNVKQEIYAYGFRNPWRMSFDSQTGNLWTGDVGQNKIEEIDIVVSGGNYGWKFFEGTDCFSGNCDATGLVPPIFEYTHVNGDRSITGGYVYRGSANSSIRGKYVYGDFISGRIWALETDGSKNELLFDSDLSIASFGTDSSQELYLCAFNGKIYTFEEN